MARIGEYWHRVSCEAPAVVPDGEGGSMETWGPLEPALWDCSIESATARALENITAGTVIAQATHIVRGRFHPGLTTKARLVKPDGAILNLLDVRDPDGRRDRTICVCSELIE
jgi:head-tail adaptor